MALNCPILDIKAGDFIFFDVTETTDDLELGQVDEVASLFAGLFKKKFTFRLNTQNQSYDFFYENHKNKLLEGHTFGLTDILNVPLRRIDNEIKYEINYNLTAPGLGDVEYEYTLEYNNLRDIIDKFRIDGTSTLGCFSTSNNPPKREGERWFLIYTFKFNIEGQVNADFLAATAAAADPWQHGAPDPEAAVEGEKEESISIIIVGLNKTQQGDCLTEFEAGVGAEFTVYIKIRENVIIEPEFEKQDGEISLPVVTGEKIGTVGNNDIIYHIV